MTTSRVGRGARTALIWTAAGLLALLALGAVPKAAGADDRSGGVIIRTGGFRPGKTVVVKRGGRRFGGPAIVRNGFGNRVIVRDRFAGRRFARDRFGRRAVVVSSGFSRGVVVKDRLGGRVFVHDFDDTVIVKKGFGRRVIVKDGFSKRAFVKDRFGRRVFVSTGGRSFSGRSRGLRSSTFNGATGVPSIGSRRFR